MRNYLLSASQDGTHLDCMKITAKFAAHCETRSQSKKPHFGNSFVASCQCRQQRPTRLYSEKDHLLAAGERAQLGRV